MVVVLVAVAMVCYCCCYVVLLVCLSETICFMVYSDNRKAGWFLLALSFCIYFCHCCVVISMLSILLCCCHYHLGCSTLVSTRREKEEACRKEGGSPTRKQKKRCWKANGRSGVVLVFVDVCPGCTTVICYMLSLLLVLLSVTGSSCFLVFVVLACRVGNIWLKIFCVVVRFSSRSLVLSFGLNFHVTWCCNIHLLLLLALLFNIIRANNLADSLATLTASFAWMIRGVGPIVSVLQRLSKNTKRIIFWNSMPLQCFGGLNNGPKWPFWSYSGGQAKVTLMCYFWIQEWPPTLDTRVALHWPPELLFQVAF